MSAYTLILKAKSLCFGSDAAMTRYERVMFLMMVYSMGSKYEHALFGHDCLQPADRSRFAYPVQGRYGKSVEARAVHPCVQTCDSHLKDK